eukprot:TRINITY_DN458_c0_g1_i4.p1 TRINITY_DN458_c0_g1~~TRINITY_DN458_c0_g1_i4.p1  ORF type:complete len:201 (+),score=34.43 TRINITY_DN458_c0_g1_i4:96-698(+)
MIRRPPRSTLSSSSAASDVYKRQGINAEYGEPGRVFDGGGWCLTMSEELIDYVEESDLHAIMDEWDRYDKDHSGSITADEYKAGEKAWYKKMYGRELSDAQLDSIFAFWKRFELTDANNEVGWWEFANAKALLLLEGKGELHKCLTPTELEDARAAFDFIDTDKSGSICESEARAYYKHRYDRDVANYLRTRENAKQVPS